MTRSGHDCACHNILLEMDFSWLCLLFVFIICLGSACFQPMNNELELRHDHLKFKDLWHPAKFVIEKLMTAYLICCSNQVSNLNFFLG